MAEITVIIPNYNGMKYMKDCLDALLFQEDAPEYEVLVVDNGSTDGSLEQTRELFPKVRVIALSENTGFCHAVNVGIEASQSPYLILLNNDTKVDSCFVGALYKSITQKADAFSVSARMLMWDRPDRMDGAGDRYCVFGWGFARGKGKPATEFEKPCRIFSACGGAAIYKKSVLDRIGLLDEAHFAYLEDMDLGYRAQIYGYKNYYEPQAKVVHFGSASTGSRYNAWKTEICAANNVYMVLKNMPLLQLLVNLPFLLLGYFVKFLFFCRKKMGKTYLTGLRKGLKKGFSKEGKEKKIRFLPCNLRHYLSIQLQLYAACVQIIMKS